MLETMKKIFVVLAPIVLKTSEMLIRIFYINRTIELNKLNKIKAGFTFFARVDPWKSRKRLRMRKSHQNIDEQML